MGGEAADEGVCAGEKDLRLRCRRFEPNLDGRAVEAHCFAKADRDLAEFQPDDGDSVGVGAAGGEGVDDESLDVDRCAERLTDFGEFFSCPSTFSIISGNLPDRFRPVNACCGVESSKVVFGAGTFVN